MVAEAAAGTALMPSEGPAIGNDIKTRMSNQASADLLASVGR